MRDVSGAPIAGAQVLIVGSAFASTTNEQGYYFINSVPAGVVTVRAQYIGYAPAEARGIRVLAGQTITVPLQLTPQTVQVEGITVEVVANPIVPRDQVASKPIVEGDIVQSLPVSSVNDALRLQPGVVEGRGGNLAIRGGRPGEAAVYIDGVPVRSLSGRTGTATVGTDALEEASVTTGAIGATQGDAQSGVISLVTRSGGQRFSPFLRLESDNMAGQTYGQGLTRLEASLGGPLVHNLTYFVSTVMEGRQTNNILGKGSENAPLYALNGTDTVVTVPVNPGAAVSDSARVALPAFTRYSSGMRRPDNWGNDWNIDGKVTYSYGTGSRFSVAYHRTRGEGLNFRGSGPGGGIYDPQSQTGFLNVSNALILNWAQNLTHSSEHALSLDASFSLMGQQTTGGLIDQSWLADHRSSSTGFVLGNIPFLINQDNFKLDDRLIQNIRVNNCLQGRDAARATMGACVPFISRSGDFATFTSFRSNPYGAPTSAYPLTGQSSAGVNLANEKQTYGRASLDWQANRYNRVQVGGEFLRADVRTFNSNMTQQIFMDAAAYKPNRMGLFAQDRVDLGDVVIDLGLRYDRLNSNVLFPRVAGRIFSDPLRGGTAGLAKLTQEGITPTAQDTAVATACQNAMAANDTTAWSTCNLFKGATHSVLQPSIRVSFPVTDRTGFRLSYAQQAQTPDFNRYAASVNTDLAITNTNSIWGQDISYGKSILFEFGVRHAFSEDMVLDVSAYNKDKVSDVAGRVLPYLDPFYGTQQAINLYTNQDFGNVRGVDFKLDRRVGSLFQASLSYTFQTAKSTGSDPTEYLNTYARQISAITGDREPPPQAALTTADNRTHTIAGDLVLNLPQGWNAGTTIGSILQGFGAYATFLFASGLAYTPMPNLGTGTLGPGNGFGLSGQAAAPLNSFTTPWQKNVNLRLTRGFQLGGQRNLTVFADFRNLFNFTNVVNIFAETGDIHNGLYQAKQSCVGPVNCTSQSGISSAYSQFTSEFGSPISKTVNGQSLSGWDLSDCSAIATSAGQAQIPDCIMMRRVEARFADASDPNGSNMFLTTDELARAYSAWFNRYSGTYSLVGPGMTFRLGFELNF